MRDLQLAAKHWEAHDTFRAPVWAPSAGSGALSWAPSRRKLLPAIQRKNVRATFCMPF